MVVLTAWSLAAAAAVVLGASTCFCLLPEACRLRLSPCLRALPFPCGPKRRPPEPEPERERVERVPQFAARRPPPVERPVPVPFARRLSARGPAPDGRLHAGSRKSDPDKDGSDDLFYFPASVIRGQIVMEPEEVERQLSYASLFVAKQERRHQWK
ncbi:hypothetical protein R5R35_006580 [Gryllus longicercus]|uniref:Uncharacterized protein n=1 Tax=Gryllus longicercus TaxID=2509291 RepID=A0AAN9VWG7_9ORTH